jgi:MYXO-CTERM domain-containing protein
VSGHIDVHSTIPGAVDQRVVVAGTATAAVVDAPALVDFGAVDVAGAAPTHSVTIKNTGTAVLTIPSVSRLAGSSDVFQATLPAGVTSLAPGMALAIPVTYQPAVAQAPGSYDTLTLVVALSGAVAGPGQSMITIRGRGIDRALELAAPPSFPPTAPNPGSAAPERAVTIRNRGEAVLQITALAITGAPVWQLVDDQPIAIAGGESHDVRIRFAPTALGPAPEGRLTLTSDDRAHATATVVLTGTGAHPDVALGPTTIDLGDVAIGAAATAELRITNHDATRAITVHDLVLDSPLFTVAGAAGSLIDAGMSRTFPVRFAPTASTTPGAVHATATLYVEGDPAPLAMVALTARALAADEPSGGGGGGGCATGAAPGSAGVLGLVTSLGLLGLARIRRRRAPRQV